MNHFDGATTVVLDAPLAGYEAPQPIRSLRDIKASGRRRIRIGLLLVAVLCTLAVGPWLQSRASYWKQTERNRFIAQRVESSLLKARRIALTQDTSTRWTQSVLGRDDQPRMEGNTWHISVGKGTTLGREVINADLGTRLHCPEAEVIFDPRGVPVAGARQIRIDSAVEADAFIVDIDSNGAIASHAEKGDFPREDQDARIQQAKA